MTYDIGDVTVPARVAALAGTARLTPVWLNGFGGLTFRATGDGTDRYIKHGPLNDESTMADEALRMRWAARWTSVPEVLDQGQDGTHEWLVTRAIDAQSAVSPRWINEPAIAVRAVGEALRAFHDALPVADCPWEWTARSRLVDLARRGHDVPDALRTPPPVDRLVVCHGDACCPNTLLTDEGRWAAHVDLATIGVGDRWADIAVAAMSTEWNYGEGWEDTLIAAYGVTPDRERLAYYRDLWNAG